MQLVKLRDKVLVLATKNERHYTTTWFLAALSFAMIFVAITKHWELHKAQQKIDGLQLSGGCGVEQHDKLTQCQNEVMNLKGQYSIYKELTGNNSVAVADKDEIKGMLKDQVSKEAKNYEECKETLKSVQSELRQTDKNNTNLLVEKERLNSKYMKCNDELVKCSEEVTKCSQNLKQ